MFSLVIHYNASTKGILGGLPPTDTEETPIEATTWEQAFELAKRQWEHLPKTGEQFATCALLCEVRSPASPRLHWFTS